MISMQVAFKGERFFMLLKNTWDLGQFGEDFKSQHDYIRQLWALLCLITQVRCGGRKGGQPGACFSQSFQSLSRVQLFATPWITAHQASLSITNSQSSLKLTSIESVMPSSHLILCRPLFLLPPIPPSIRVFSNESTLRVRWPKYWSFSVSIIPSKEHPGLISFACSGGL